MPGLWRLAAAPGAGRSGQSCGHGGAELTAQGNGHLGPGHSDVHQWHYNAALRHERKFIDAISEKLKNQ